LVVQQGVFDQADGSPIPGVVGAHAKLGLLLEDHGAVPSIANLKTYRVFGSAGSRDDPDKGLIRAELERDVCLAAAARSQRSRLQRLGIGAAGVDETVPSGLGDQLARLIGDSLQLRSVIRSFANERSSGTIIFQLEIKYGNLDRRWRLGACKQRWRQRCEHSD
jgi:hypothetical protein